MFGFNRKLKEAIITTEINNETKTASLPPETLDPLSIDLKKCVTLFSKCIKPALNRTGFGDINAWSDKPFDIDFYTKNFSREEMGGFLSLIDFIDKHRVEDFHSEKSKESFQNFVQDFLSAVNLYFAQNFGTHITYSPIIKYREKEDLKDAAFIINQDKSDLSYNMLFKLINLDKSFKVAEWFEEEKPVFITCSLNDIIPHLSEKKQIELCNYLFSEKDINKFNENMNYINFENPVENIVGMIGTYYDHLADSEDTQQIEKLRNSIFTHFYSAFNDFTLDDHNYDIDFHEFDNTEGVKFAFFTEFFVKELIKNDKLFDFMQELDPSKSNYMKASLDERKRIYDETEKYYIVRYNNISFMIKNYLNSSFDTLQLVRGLDKNFTMTTGKEVTYINEDEFPESSKSYDEISYRP